MRETFLLGALLALAWLALTGDAAMRKCQETHSFAVCQEVLK